VSAGIRREPKGHYYIMLRKGIGPIYAERGGGLVLRDETSWRKLSGFWLNTRWGCFWIYFRRAAS
jgi:hypothetical protein